MKFFYTLILSFAFSQAFTQVSLEAMALESGDYHVGFRNFTAYDSSRTYQRIYDWNNQLQPRPIPISVWYPASEPGGEKLKILDYMRILKEEEEWEHLPDEFILNWFYYPNTPQNQAHLRKETNAFANPEIRKGRFPVIIYAPSYQASSIENFGLCEVLASHGYIVISSPSRGSGQRFFEGATLKDAETQARDIQFLISRAKSLKNADPARIASIGFSYGGLSNVLAQAQNKDIKVIVSLDGSIKYQYATIENSTFFDVNQFDIPFLHMSQKDIPMEVMIADKIDTTLNTRFDFFDELTRSSAHHLKFNYLTHSYFSTLGVLFQTRDPRQDKSDSEIMQSYRWLTQYTLHFLNAQLLGNAASKAWFANPPEKNGIPAAGLSKIASKEPVPSKFTFQDFNEKAAAQNYEDLLNLFEGVITDEPTFEIPEGRLNNLGLQLTFNPKSSQQGIRVFQFATELYPASSNLFDSMAEAYLFIGDQSRALQNFQRSLELDASNQNAKDRIKQLSK